MLPGIIRERKKIKKKRRKNDEKKEREEIKANIVFLILICSLWMGTKGGMDRRNAGKRSANLIFDRKEL